MLDVNLNDTEPKHVERVSPQITVDDSGNVVWTPSLLDYDASVFHRGKTVTNKEFNTLFLRQLYQGNYITDSLSKFLTEHLGTAIHRKFTNTYKLVKSYTKVFTAADWVPGNDGYSYITIPASEHGFEPIEDGAGKGMNIDTELYLLNTDGRFYEIDQITTDPDNTVTLYTDDTDIVGFVVIRSNERSYAMSGSSINAEDINGLMPIARTGLYSDLYGAPDLSGIGKNTEAINKIIDGTTLIGKAQNANNVLEKIGNQFITDIFETGSSVVKQATNTKNYITGGNIESKFNELNDTITTLQHSLTNTINTVDSNLRNELSTGALIVNKALSDSAGNNIANTYASLTDIRPKNLFKSINNTENKVTLSEAITNYYYCIVEFTTSINYGNGHGHQIKHYCWIINPAVEDISGSWYKNYYAISFTNNPKDVSGPRYHYMVYFYNTTTLKFINDAAGSGDGLWTDEDDSIVTVTAVYGLVHK